LTYDLVVVGAGFAGLACARKAALAGLRVALLEKKHTAGARLHTTGMIVKDAVDSIRWLRDVPQDMVRPIEGVKLYAPNLSHVALQAPGYYFWATDAVRFLDWMVQLAVTAGVEMRFGALFTSARIARAGEGWEIPLESGEVLQARYLVGADGPHSRVAKALDLSQNRHFLFGVEHEYAHAGVEPNYLHCFLDAKLAPGYIGWAFAGVGATQVGLARRMTPGQRQGRLDMEGFLRKTAGIVAPEGDPLSIRAGMIPCGGLLPRVARSRGLLIGDAAGLVSPATAGGIHAALRFGEDAATGVSAFLHGKAPDPAEWLTARYPRFRAKRALRRFFEATQTDWMYNRLLGTRVMRGVAEWVYFHAKGSDTSHGSAQERA
jgi:digeranylgeranylglycerophospholipid reductase